MSFSYKHYHTGIFLVWFLFVSLVFGVLNFAHAQGGARSIEVKTPNGGEALVIGETYRITWDATENIDTVTIGWTKGPGSLNWVANNIPNNGYYDWTLDSSVSTESLKIDITGYDTGYGSVSDESDNYFNVSEQPRIASIIPATAQVGDVVTITGAGFNSATYIDVVGENMTITPTTRSSTQLTFVVPASIGIGSHVVRTIEKAGTESDASNSVEFTVVSSDSLLVVDIKAGGKDGPVTIPPGTAEILSWTSENESFCSASVVGTQSTWGGPISASGAQGTGNLTATHTFTISCQDAAGNTAIDSVTVNVSEQPIITNFTADASPSGAYINLQWSASAPTDAHIDFSCPINSIEFYIKEDGRTVGCAKGGLVSYTNQSSNVISVNPRNNSTPVTVSFTLSLLKDGIPTGEKRTVTVTVLAQKEDSTGDAPVISSVFPTVAQVGETVTVFGSGFDNSSYIQLGNALTFKPNAYTNNTINFTAPGTLGAGTFSLRVGQKAGELSNPLTLTITFQGVTTKEEGLSDGTFVAKEQLFARNLWRGMQSNDVRKLQELLAQDESLYPEGLTTGYYGFLTQSAVQNFQCRYGIVCSGTPDSTGYGVVGPKTRAKLNEVYGRLAQPKEEKPFEGSGGTTTGVQGLQQQIQDLLELVRSLQEQVDNLR